MNKLLDGDLNTSIMAVADIPFVRVQLNTSTEIGRLDITLVIGRYNRNFFKIFIMKWIKNLLF